MQDQRRTHISLVLCCNESSQDQGLVIATWRQSLNPCGNCPRRNKRKPQNSAESSYIFFSWRQRRLNLEDSRDSSLAVRKAALDVRPLFVITSAKKAAEATDCSRKSRQGGENEEASNFALQNLHIFEIRSLTDLPCQPLTWLVNQSVLFD